MVSKPALGGFCFFVWKHSSNGKTLKARLTSRKFMSASWRGALPGLANGKFSDRDVFYASYLKTYIERDVSELLDRVDKLLFQDFIRAAACRAGQMRNVHDIATDIGVIGKTGGSRLRPPPVFSTLCLG